jgi:hypothetical protein
MGSASTSSVQALRGNPDDAACQSLRSAVDAQPGRTPGYYSFAFYRSGDRYFVVLTPPAMPAGKVVLRHEHAVEVYDRDFRFLARFGI